MTALSRLRTLPWLLVFEAARTVQTHVTQTLSPRDRRRVTEIVRRSRGLPQNVTESERAELRAIARKLDLPRLGRELVPRVVSARGRGGRRRR